MAPVWQIEGLTIRLMLWSVYEPRIMYESLSRCMKAVTPAIIDTPYRLPLKPAVPIAAVSGQAAANLFV